MTFDIVTELRDTADALTNPTQVRNPRHGWDANRHKVVLPDHVVTLPGLIAQVAEIVWPNGASNDGSARGVPSTRPPGNPQASAVVIDIHIGVTKWHMRWGLVARDTIESSIRQLLAKAMSQDTDTQWDLLCELRSWRYRCEVVLKEATNDPQVQVPCPVEGCGERTLRVNIAKKTARCTTCRARWSETPDPERGIWSIVGLADHIRTYEAEARGAADEARRLVREDKRRVYRQPAA